MNLRARLTCSFIGRTPARTTNTNTKSAEEALTALDETGCNLEDFEPALKRLANGNTAPACVKPWTLDQVGATRSSRRG